MLISQENKDELIFKCVDLISKTFVELGQSKAQEEIVILAQSLTDDIKRDFKGLMFSDIENGFRNGVRNSDLFALNVKTYYKWIKTWRDILWDAEYQVTSQGKEPKSVAHYRPQPKLLR
jgi:hypothetical protein|tara:strand:+ start:566 stop:922 length:357 start_codon:yes stop_codon:yes gene_type:complete